MSNNKRYDKTEEAIHYALNRALARRTISLRVCELCADAKISDPTFYLHCRNCDDALRQYELKIEEEFVKLLPRNANNSVAFTILLNFIRRHQCYFISTLKHDNYYLLTKLIDHVIRLRVDVMISKRAYAVYVGSISAIIVCWVKYDKLEASIIPDYVRRLTIVRAMNYWS